MKVVFYLHRVYPESGPDDLSLKSFERVLKAIKGRFKVVPLQELLSSDSEGNLASITFDDGYADNWVYAYPILKKLGLKAHLFITANRIQNAPTVRPTLSDYWSGKVSLRELFKPTSMGECHIRFFRNGDRSEFLTWEELHAMADVFTFGAHGLNHGKLPVSEEIVDFFDGKNLHRDFLFPEPELFPGKPRFKTRSTLWGRAFIPSRELLELCRSFPKEGNWKERLRQELRSVKTGRLETEREAASRIESELLETKRLIRENLGIEPDTFSWPFGHYTSLSREVASKHHSFLFTTKRGVLNGASPLELPRVPLGRDLFTALGRVITFSTPLWRLYQRFKRGKSL
ncbi:polysaccharide deacetylase family protein [Thermovibrio ammonificans]